MLDLYTPYETFYNFEEHYQISPTSYSISDSFVDAAKFRMLHIVTPVIMWPTSKFSNFLVELLIVSWSGKRRILCDNVTLYTLFDRLGIISRDSPLKIIDEICTESSES